MVLNVITKQNIRFQVVLNLNFLENNDTAGLFYSMYSSKIHSNSSFGWSCAHSLLESFPLSQICFWILKAWSFIYFIFTKWVTEDTPPQLYLQVWWNDSMQTTSVVIIGLEGLLLVWWPQSSCILRLYTEPALVLF